MISRLGGSTAACASTSVVPALITPSADRPRQRQDGCAISLDGDWVVFGQARRAVVLHAALYENVHVIRSRVWDSPSLGLRRRQVGEKFPSTRNGHARERERETGTGRLVGNGLHLADQSVSRPGPQRTQTRLLDCGRLRVGFDALGFPAVPPSWQESSGWCSIYVQINHPAIVGPSADESCISCIDTYLYSTVFHPQQAKGYTLLRNRGAFIGQAASPLRSCCARSSLQVSLLVAAARERAS